MKMFWSEINFDYSKKTLTGYVRVLLFILTLEYNFMNQMINKIIDYRCIGLNSGILSNGTKGILNIPKKKRFE